MAERCVGEPSEAQPTVGCQDRSSTCPRGTWLAIGEGEEELRKKREKKNIKTKIIRH